MKTQDIFNSIQVLNPASTTISSMGQIITESSLQLSERAAKEIASYLPEGSIAAEIVKRGYPFSAKQLWVIAYELEKNADFVARMEASAKAAESMEAAKRARNQAKRAAKKATKDAIAANDTKNSALNVGDQVRHATFGEGTVTAMDAGTVTVDFAGTAKKMMKQFARLEKIN